MYMVFWYSFLLPKHINADTIIRTISPDKDVDGFHPESVGRLCIGEPGFVSCTPAGIIQLLKRSGIEIEGKECVVVGRSNIVGKPMSILLLRENGTVTITHSRTKDLKEVTGRADILVVAIGKPKFITADYVKEGAVVIDVGMHRNEENKLCGDVDFDDIKDKVSAITPVPGWSWSYDNRYADVQLCRSSEGSGGRVEHEMQTLWCRDAGGRA